MSNVLFDALTVTAPGRLWLETQDGRRLTYGDLYTLTGQLAQVLVEAGVRPGDRVASNVEKSPEALALYLAVVRTGAVFLPLNTAYTAAELAYFLGDADPVLFVTDPSRAAVRPRPRPRRWRRGLSSRCETPRADARSWSGAC